jgi:DNA polymerase III epsilon subunit-like protein
MSTKLTIAQRAQDYIAKSALILDTETTAKLWENSDAEACEIAIVNAQGTTEFQSLIKTVYPIDDETSGYHGITNEMCRSAPTWFQLFPVVSAIIGVRPVLAYNAGFDRPVLENNCRLVDTILPTWQWGCLMEDWKSFDGLYKWDKLEVAVAKIGYQWEGKSHRAMADAKAARAVLLHIAAYEEPRQEQLIEVPQMTAAELGE